MEVQLRGVMDVVPTPPGVKPMKSRSPYKRKYNKDCSIKKYKARLVALRCGHFAMRVLRVMYTCNLHLTINCYLVTVLS